MSTIHISLLSRMTRGIMSRRKAHCICNQDLLIILSSKRRLLVKHKRSFKLSIAPHLINYNCLLASSMLRRGIPQMSMLHLQSQHLITFNCLRATRTSNCSHSSPHPSSSTKMCADQYSQMRKEVKSMDCLRK